MMIGVASGTLKAVDLAFENGSTCDRCGPYVVAQVKVVYEVGMSLTFCYHCFFKNQVKLSENSVIIIHREAQKKVEKS